MSFTGFILMCLFTLVGIKYLVDMIRYGLGYESNGKCRYGKKYARALIRKKRTEKKKYPRAIPKQDKQLHEDVSRLITQLNAG